MFILNGFVALARYWYLLVELVKRDFKVRYKRSILGVLWSVLNPLLTMLVLNAVFSQLFKTVDNYSVYLFSGLVIFNYFSEATNLAMISILSNFGLITKVYIPKFVLPVSKVLSSAVNFFFTVLSLYIILFFKGISVNINHLALPFVFLTLMMFILGISFMVSALAVFFRDLVHLYSVFITMWMYLTPILYPLEIVPENFRQYIVYNPLYHFITFVRTIIVKGSLPDPTAFLVCFAYGIGSLLIGLTIFKYLQDDFIYYA